MYFTFSDVNMLSGKRLPNSSGKLTDFKNFRDQDWFSFGKTDSYCREYPSRDQKFTYDQYKTDINGNKYNQSLAMQSGNRDQYSQYGSASYNTQYSNYNRDGYYNHQTGVYGGSTLTDPNYNQTGRYNNYYRDDYGSSRRNDDSRYSSSRHRNKNEMLSSWRDPSTDRRRRREHDRYITGDRELPPTPPVLGRRHSWDTHGNGYGRGKLSNII